MLICVNATEETLLNVLPQPFLNPSIIVLLCHLHFGLGVPLDGFSDVLQQSNLLPLFIDGQL